MTKKAKKGNPSHPLPPPSSHRSSHLSSQMKNKAKKGNPSPLPPLPPPPPSSHLSSQMKNKTQKGNPSPPPPPSSHLSALPAALSTLALQVLSADEQEVLAYFYAAGGCNGEKKTSDMKQHGKNKAKKGNKSKSHPPHQFGCPCLDCYKNFWARLDSSPNARVIDTILDEFDKSLAGPKETTSGASSSRGKRSGRMRGPKKRDDHGEAPAVQEITAQPAEEADEGDETEEEEEKNGCLRRFLSCVLICFRLKQAKKDEKMG